MIQMLPPQRRNREQHEQDACADRLRASANHNRESEPHDPEDQASNGNH
jgi:hypothetical protein